MTSEAPATTDAAASVEAAARVGTAVQSVISGKPETVRLAVTVLLAGGHLLIEDVPGVGKTMLARRAAAFGRIPPAAQGDSPPARPRGRDRRSA